MTTEVLISLRSKTKCVSGQLYRQPYSCRQPTQQLLPPVKVFQCWQLFLDMGVQGYNILGDIQPSSGFSGTLTWKNSNTCCVHYRAFCSILISNLSINMTSEALYDSDAGKRSDVQTGMVVQTAEFYLSFGHIVHLNKTRQALQIRNFKVVCTGEWHHPLLLWSCWSLFLLLSLHRELYCGLHRLYRYSVVFTQLQSPKQTVQPVSSDDWSRGATVSTHSCLK